MRTFGQLLDYSTTTLGREPYLTEADLGLIHERLEQWRDETRALSEVETQMSLANKMYATVHKPRLGIIQSMNSLGRLGRLTS